MYVFSVYMLYTRVYILVLLHLIRYMICTYPCDSKGYVIWAPIFIEISSLVYLVGLVEVCDQFVYGLSLIAAPHCLVECMVGCQVDRTDRVF